MDYDQYYFKLSPVNGSVGSESGGTSNAFYRSLTKKDSKSGEFSDKFQKAKEKQKENKK